MNAKNKLSVFADNRGGNLIPIEFFSLPFEPKRMFSVTDVPKDAIRGHHAHYETEQILYCMAGEILVGLDDGYSTTEVILRAGESILIPKLVWDYQQFLTGNEFMIVLASTNYNLSDYIHDRDEFYQIVRNVK